MSAAVPRELSRTTQTLETIPMGPAPAGTSRARPLRVRAVDIGSRALLRVSGPLDGATLPALGEALQRFRCCGQGLTLDLRPVEYIETPGLRLLMTLNEELQAEGGQVRLVVRQGSRVERTLRLAGLDHQCAVFHTVREALSEPSGPAAAPTGGTTRGGA